MLISSLILFNEIDLLRLRLEHDYPIVDGIILIEATRTFAGRPKPLYFDRYRHLFREYLDKITHVVVDDMPAVEPTAYVGTGNQPAPEYRWHLEEHQRNCLVRGLDRIGANDADVVLLTDVDEFLDAGWMRRIATSCRVGEVHYPILTEYRETVAKPPVSVLFTGPYATKCGHLRAAPPGLLRNARGDAMNQFHWRNPVNNLKLIRRCGRAVLAKGLEGLFAPTVDYGQMAGMMAVRESRGDPPIRAVLAAAGIRRGIEHPNAGWHLTCMSGGYDAWSRLKVQNFSHSECQVEGAAEDAQKDIYAEWRTYIDDQVAANAYDYSAVHPPAPTFVHERIRDFPVLLLPQRVPSQPGVIEALVGSGSGEAVSTEQTR